jgi:hypothetical protein
MAPEQNDEQHRLYSTALRSIPIGVVEDAPRLGEAFPALAMTLGAAARRDDDIVRFEAAAAALELEDSHAIDGARKRIVGREMSF